MLLFTEITTNTSENVKSHLIIAYAPTLENTVRNPDETRIFYEQLSSLINSIKQRDVLIIVGDFNAKTKLQVSEMENQFVVGKYAKNVKSHLISTYAPTLENTVRNPDETRIFFEQLSSLINSIKQKGVLIIGGDFNAKTKLQVSEMENQLVVGKYAKN